MKENSLYDKKSLRAIYGKQADYNEIAKDCIAFCNAQGGRIDFGIEDKEELPPAEQIIPPDLPTILVNKIRSLANGVVVSTEINKASNGGEYLTLCVARNPNSIAMTTSGKTYLRVGDNSMPVGPEDIYRLVEDKGNYKWEDQLTNFSWKNCDIAKLNSFLYDVRHSDRVSNFIKQKEDKELLDSFFMTDMDSDKLTNLGVLFVGKQTQRGRISNAPVIQCIKYDDLGEKVNKWLWDDYSLNPTEMIEDVWEKVPEWKESTEVSEGLFRTNILAYPEKVIRELLSNSIVHRLYTVSGDIFINIHPHFIEIINPGRLPLGVTAENILHKTKKRNEHLANIFYALHLMEREGSGYDMMYEVLLSQGKKIPVVIEGDDYVKVIVERRIVNQEAIKVMQLAYQNFDIKQKQAICLGLIAQHESLTSLELQVMLNLHRNEELRPWLLPLINKGLVVSNHTHSKSQEYRVEPKLLRNSNYKGKTSLKRIENYRIKELIREDLKIYKKASLPDIHQRIGMEIPYRKLQLQMKDLIKDGIVKQNGTKRWATYELL